MRNLLLAWCIAAILSSCAGSKQNKASVIGLVPLNNYFVKNTVPLTEEYTYKVITGKAEFDAIFGAAGTMNNTVRQPDFNGQTVVAVMGGTSARQQEIILDGATVAGKDMQVYYRVKKGGTHSAAATALSLATVPKAISVKQVSFYQDSLLVKTVPVDIY